MFWKTVEGQIIMLQDLLKYWTPGDPNHRIAVDLTVLAQKFVHSKDIKDMYALDFTAF